MSRENKISFNNNYYYRTRDRKLLSMVQRLNETTKMFVHFSNPWKDIYPSKFIF